MALLLLVPVALAADTPSKSPSSLIIEEADAVVELYEIRLHNEHMRAEQEDLKWNLVKENFERMEQAHKNGAVNERVYREAKYEYDYWSNQDKIKDIAEAEVNLKLAKIRQRMARAGMRPYGKISDYGVE
jgi:hypothetical protein